MAWATNDELLNSLPELAKLPGAAVSLFREVANRQLAKSETEAGAFKVAWGVVKNRFEQVNGEWVARTASFSTTEYFTFNATPAEGFVTRTENGVELHNYVLADVWPDNFGTAPTEELLGEWASWINQAQPEADTDHDIYEQAMRTYGDNPEKVKSMVRSKRGIAKAVKAVVDKGRLLVSLAFDKRYANHIDRVKGLSIEAAVVKNGLTSQFEKGELLGFTLAVNAKPANPRAIKA